MICFSTIFKNECFVIFRYEPVLVQEMLTLIIQIVKERRFSGLTTAECLKRELIYKLSIGDATHSQLVKSLPRDLSKFEQLQDILDTVAVYSNPSGFNQVCSTLGKNYHFLLLACVYRDFIFYVRVCILCDGHFGKNWICIIHVGIQRIYKLLKKDTCTSAVSLH